MTRSQRVVLLGLPVVLAAAWIAEAHDVPWSLIDHGEYHWRARELRAALGAGDLGDAAELLFERRHPFDAPLGRCRPFYWAYCATMTSLSQAWTPFFTIFSSLVFAAAVALLGRIAFAVTRSLPLALLAQAILALASTSTAMWLRVGCHEPLMMLTAGGALALALGPAGGPAVPSARRTAAACVLLALFFFAKEVSVHFVATLGALWLFFARREADPVRARRVRALVLTGLASAAALLVTYRLVVGTPESGTYSSAYRLDAGVFASRLALFRAWTWDDFHCLAVLILASAAVRAARGPRTFRDRVAAVLLVECAAYVAIYLPWTNLPDRVVPGFTFSFALLAAIEAQAWIEAARGAGAARHLARAALAAGALAAAGGLLDGPLASQREAASLRARYQADRDLVAALAERAPPGGTVLFDLPLAQKELGFGAGLHLALWHGRGDVRARVLSVEGAPIRGDLVADYQGRESAAGRAARADAAPVTISRSAELSLWTVRNALRSAVYLVRRGDWPGVPRSRKTYSWRVWPGR